MAHILVIERDEMVLSMLERMLMRLGHTTVGTASVDVGVEIAVDQCPALIITDVDPPHPSSWNSVVQLRTDHRTAHIPVIIISASAVPSDNERALAVGAHGLVSKPFQAAHLIAKVATALGNL